MLKWIPLCGVILVLASCSKDERDKGLTKEQAQQRADSIYKTKVKKLKQQAAEDLDRRMSIELKPKIDSLLGRTSTATPPPSLNTEIPVDIPVKEKDTTDVPTDTVSK